MPFDVEGNVKLATGESRCRAVPHGTRHGGAFDVAALDIGRGAPCGATHTGQSPIRPLDGWRVSLMAALLWAMASSLLLGQAGGGVSGLSPRLESLVGSDSYRFYCAACHGSAGRGDGPVASSLKTPVADLTTIARRNGGVYPAARVRAAILNTERPITAHGTGDMPVWGWVFRVLESSDARADVRIANLVSYVGTLQQGGNGP